MLLIILLYNNIQYSAETNFDPTFNGQRAGIWIGLKGKKEQFL
jgi:hypothetical protein